MNISRIKHHNQKGAIMRKKGFYTTLFVILLGLISIYLFAVIDIQLKESAQRVDVEKYNIYRTLEVVVLICFGILIEYKRIIFTFKNKISINKYYLITGIGLVVLLVLPYELISQLGIGHPSSIKGTISLVLNSINTRSILSVLTGILLARSFSVSKPTEQIF